MLLRLQGAVRLPSHGHPGSPTGRPLNRGADRSRDRRQLGAPPRLPHSVSDGARAPSDRELAWADVVPMHGRNGSGRVALLFVVLCARDCGPAKPPPHALKEKWLILSDGGWVAT